MSSEVAPSTGARFIPGSTGPIRVALDGHVIGRRMTGNETYILNLAEALARRDDVAPTLYVDRGISWQRSTPIVTKRLISRWAFLKIPLELAVRPSWEKQDLLHVQYVGPPIRPSL